MIGIPPHSSHCYILHDHLPFSKLSDISVLEGGGAPAPLSGGGAPAPVDRLRILERENYDMSKVLKELKEVIRPDLGLIGPFSKNSNSI